MKQIPYPRTIFTAFVLLLLASACGRSTPTGVEKTDVQGTWSGTFDNFSVMGRTLSGDADWTFTKDTFEIIFFNQPDDQAERISGEWKFADERIALKLKSSFPIDSDIGATDTLFVSILRDEMSIKTIAESTIRLVKTRLAFADRAAYRQTVCATDLRSQWTPTNTRATTILDRRSERADIRIQSYPQRTPT